MEKERNVKREYKDRLFNYIFGQEENREWTLSLYNAINGSDYTDASLIEFNTLRDKLYMGMRNDTSFIVEGLLNLYEHQSSYNPNMPLRLMEYTSELYSGYIAQNKYNKYGSMLIKLPTPRLVVFYNGLSDEPDETILRLSDSFDDNTKNNADIEVKVRMLNINYGRNKALMEKCKPLLEYSWFIDKIRELAVKYKQIEPAVKEAIKLMPVNYQIREFILKNKAEVEGMLDTEYNEDEIRELFMEDGRREMRARVAAAEERIKKEKERADSAEERVNIAEARIKELEAMLLKTEKG